MAAANPSGFLPSPFAAGGVTIVEAGPRQWHYGWEAAPTDQYFDGRLAVTVRAHVRRGMVGIGVLNRDRQEFFHEIWLAEGEGPQTIQLMTPEFSELGPLVVRNYSDKGSSQVEIEVIGAEPTAYDLYLVYQPGKVASQSIEAMLQRILPPEHVERHHYLSAEALAAAMTGAEAPRSDAATYDYYYGQGGVLEQVQAASRARAKVARVGAKRTLIITGIRNPIAYSIAAFFQNLDVYCPWLTYEGDRTELEADRVLRYFSDQLSRVADRMPPESAADAVAQQKIVHPGIWFETEFQRFTDIDVYAASLRSEPFSTFCANNSTVLLYRYEALASSMTPMLRSVGLMPVAVPAVNVGSQKRYAAIYDAFQHRFATTSAVRKVLLENDYTRRFYPELLR